MTNIEYLYNPEAAKLVFNKNHFIDKKLGFQVIEHGMILPHKIIPESKSFWKNSRGGVVDNNGKFINGSHVFNDSGGAYTPPPESIQRSSETVIYLGLFFPVWGHVLTDDISRVWFLKSEYFNQFKTCRLVYIPWYDSPLESNKDFVRLLEILGLPLDRLHPITQPTQFDKIILPDNSFWGNGVLEDCSNEYRDTMDILRNFALKNRTPISNKKFYFYHGKNHVGEERLAEYFKSKGYEIINHEQRSASFDEELNLLINCESLACPLGSCAHNSVFLRDGTETVFILRRAHGGLNYYQQPIDQMRNLNANYIDSTLSILSRAGRPPRFFYIISKQMKEFFGEKWNGYEEEDFKNFLKYAKDCMSKGFTMDLQEVREYGYVFINFMDQLKRRKDLIAVADMPPRWEDEFKPQLTYLTYISMKGSWTDGLKFENQPSNPLDQQLEIMAIKIDFPAYKVYYSVYYNEEEGWTEEVSDNKWAGVTNKQKPIYGMKVHLDAAGAKEFDILYRMHKFDGTWTPWAKNGEALYSHGQKLNAIQIKLEPVKPIEDAKKFDYSQTFLTEGNEIYLQGQRQNIIQLNLQWLMRL